jgi:hypothetical protein
VINSRGGGISLVVGDDLGVNQIRLLLGKTIVGKFLGRRVSMGVLNDWLQVEWAPLVGYNPVFHLLAKGIDRVYLQDGRGCT